jgi:hypothetical protein
MCAEPAKQIGWFERKSDATCQSSLFLVRTVHDLRRVIYIPGTSGEGIGV